MPESCVWPGCDDAHCQGPDLIDGMFPLCTMHAYEVYASMKAFMPHRMADRAVTRTGKKIMPDSDDGWIYYIRVGDRIKIGHSSRIKQRLAQYPPNAVVLAVQRGTRADEQELHNRFATYCVAGREWYGEYEVLSQHIAFIRANHGDPSIFEPTRRRPPKQVVAQRSRSGGSFRR